MVSTAPKAVIERLQAAINQHDLEAFLACFDPTYQSEQPLHPDRAFTGRDQVRKNWSKIFNGVPNIEAEMLRSAVADETVWSEWHWHGTQTDGKPWRLKGVTIFGIMDNRIAWGRLYMDPIEEAGHGIDAAIGELLKPSQA